MRRIIVILCIALIVSTLSSSYAENSPADNISIYDFKRCFSESDTRSSINLTWLAERYDFGYIEDYLQEQYGTYYGYYESYNNKQREIAGKFGLSNIYVRPSFKKYDESKLVLTRNVFDNRMTLRYLAPLRDVTDFEIMMSFRPIKPLSFVIKSELNGQNSISAAITYPFGKTSEKDNETLRFTRRALKKITGIKF